MRGISLEEMKGIRLMDRIDSKYVISSVFLPELLERMASYFRVQVINEKRIATYGTQYLDTPNLEMFVMHQNGKLNRQKIRIRSYIDSNLSFLEIKNKNNKGRTKKIRVPVGLSQLQSIQELNGEKQFLEENAIFSTSDLIPALSNEFDRITCVNNACSERITIDMNLSFLNHLTNKNQLLDNLVVLELKQDGYLHSDFKDILNSMRIKRRSFSKYCMGTFLTNTAIKHNRFKSRWAIINKLTQ